MSLPVDPDFPAETQRRVSLANASAALQDETKTVEDRQVLAESYIALAAAWAEQIEPIEEEDEEEFDGQADEVRRSRWIFSRRHK